MKKDELVKKLWTFDFNISLTLTVFLFLIGSGCLYYNEAGECVYIPTKPFFILLFSLLTSISLIVLFVTWFVKKTHKD